MKLRYSDIMKEIQQVLDTSNFDSCENLINRVISARTIVLFGAGRVGLAMQGFAKRLRHAGFNSFYLEDCTVPRTGPGDIFMVGSGSGTTPSVVAVAEVAKMSGLDLVLFTANSDSKLANISNCTILLNAPSKLNHKSVGSSIQPMTTLFEQSLGIALDAIVLEILAQTNQSNESMKHRHNVIE